MPGGISWKNVLKAAFLGATSGQTLKAGRIAQDLQAADDIRASRGSMMYGRRHQSTEEPAGAYGEINPRTGEGHATQYYADGNRVSWDTDGNGESGVHWTNQNIPKGKRHRRQRHTPPPHAK